MNGELIVDLGGVHGRRSENVVYPPSGHNLEVGQVVPFQVFFASRATSPSITNYLRIDVPGGTLSNGKRVYYVLSDKVLRVT